MSEGTTSLEGALRVDVIGEVTTLTLDRDRKRNSLSEQLVDQMTTEFDAACQRSRLVVFRGVGKCFSAGFDFTDFDTQPEHHLLQRFIRLELLLQKVAHSPVETVALVHGRTFGAGADLTVACTHRVFDDDAVVRMPGWRFGLALGTRRLAQRTGTDFALRVLQGAETVDASSALDANLATHIIAQGDWDAFVELRASRTAALGRDATAQLRSMMVEDTRALDLADLTRSAVAPGLHDRIRKFRHESSGK